jgi:hypothetical protein
MIIDETYLRASLRTTITSWIVIEEEQSTKVNLGIEENVQQVKVNHLNQLLHNN